MRLIFLLMTVLVSACGGFPGLGMEGTWSGRAGLLFDADQAFTHGPDLTLKPAGSGFRATGFCPDGSGSVEVNGGTETASWSGIALCDGVIATAWCPTASVEFSRISMTIKPDGYLVGHGVVRVFGCNSTSDTPPQVGRASDWLFAGRKR